MNEMEVMRLDIERKLSSHGGGDLVIPYSQVSFAFPSSKSDTRRPDVKIIDNESFEPWAASRGWSISIANDMSASDGFFPVRFTRAAP